MKSLKLYNPNTPNYKRSSAVVIEVDSTINSPRLWEFMKRFIKVNLVLVGCSFWALVISAFINTH